MDPDLANKEMPTSDVLVQQTSRTRLEGKENPLNWSLMRKWLYTSTVVFISGIVGFSSSVQTPAIPAIAHTFGTSRLVATLASTTYLIGCAFGPQVFAPLSELWGRNPLYYSAFLIATLANLACALSPNIATFLVFRFIAGLFSLSAVANCGGTITDLWPQSNRTVPFALFTVASFCGPVLGPIIGGFLTEYAGWRWNFWLVFIVMAVNYAIMLFTLPETYAPILIERKNDKFGVKTHHEPRSTRFAQTLLRPWIMLFTEPILFSFSLYMAFIYGVLFLDFTAYPIVFQQTRGWSVGISGLSFTGIGVGMVLATILSPYANRVHSRYVQKLGPVPEARLPHLIFIVWLLPVGIFWFAWTALPPVPWIVSILSGIPFGFALVMLFTGISSYLTDCYDRYGASALAANTMLRCLFGAGFALFANTMYEKMGTPWATSTLGFIALVMGIMPLVFYRYGARLRAASKFHISVTTDGN
ncbi:MFS general substrate transporter [Polychaeton citri CBS 116435]|uniref:MFS general substrate transporter n=1 Tax=Polychaeton citri CBS 116435 TaxID=1314669 RepID=A0A9P4Q399_9PEZI|nr:MFS general substrate transporter [Polychaeton citri CBS 116435]